MKVVVLLTAVLVLFALVFPVAVSWNSAKAPDGPADPSEGTKPPASGRDGEIVALLDGGAVRSVTVREYLTGALAAEMPASFEPEALKAQAVALRSYLAYKRLHRPSSHPEADICSDSSCCAAWKNDTYLMGKWGAAYEANMAKVTAAVDATAGMTLAYEGEPAMAVFHSSSPGKTEDSGSVWGASLPYLVSVESPESEATVPDFVANVTVSADDFKETVLARYPDADLSGDISGWIGASVLDASGRLGSVAIGGVELTGAQVRSLFGLRSAAIEFAVGENTVTMTTRGYGHGVGMSQYGANVMAAGGADFRAILAAYYPGTQLTNAAGTS